MALLRPTLTEAGEGYNGAGTPILGGITKNPKYPTVPSPARLSPMIFKSYVLDLQTVF